MSNTGMSQNVETQQNEKAEKSSGLAPAAEKVLNEVFLTEQFQAFIDEIVLRYNKLAKGEGNEDDKKFLLEEVDYQLNHTVEYGPGEGLATSILQRYRDMIERIEV